jgi:hypothetical protein
MENLGLGAWTSVLKDNGFKRILALEPVPAYNKWVTVSKSVYCIDFYNYKKKKKKKKRG